MTEEQWSVFKKNVPAIEKAIRKMESRWNYVTYFEIEIFWESPTLFGGSSPVIMVLSA